ncbi:hypothetical protein SA111_01992 [Streptococcus agalactiae]|uniref:Uncharacterized protein n=3 Tax=Streptococcus TaxID=1301 RepID=A0A8B4RDY3_STRAG|nr:hypothetical protein SA111_01992 [Streptococcus agalactiae]SUN14059.1 Uncharacterised protein [Streptococcus agalactiae]SUN23851.1 Uncharacterised protein [Streptococcus agalactiae]SUN59177.1 Uncharacterised protein [Streptococcus agalactiae]
MFSFFYAKNVTKGRHMKHSYQKSSRAKQRQSRNLVVLSIMQQTGWSRERVVNSLKELEDCNLIKFPSQGGMMIKVGEVR